MLHRRRDWIIAAILFGLTFAVFSPVLRAEFVQWDDDISVAQNAHIQGLDWPRLRWMFTDSSYAMRYKPLTWLAYAIVYCLGGLKPFSYHLVSLLAHSINAVVAFVIIRRLLTLAALGGTAEVRLERSRLPAAAGALLWAVQPLRVEPVARVTDLTYELVFLCVMTSLWCYLQAHQLRERLREYRFWYGWSVAAYAVAMLSYPFAFGWALVLLVIDWYPLRRFEGTGSGWRPAGFRGILREKIPFLFWGALVLTTLLARREPSVVWADPIGGSQLDWFERGMQAMYVWAYYVWKPWLPFHLTPVYTTLVDFNANSWRFWLSAALIAGTTFGLLKQRRRWPWGLALWLGYMILLLPALGLTEHPHYTSDRYDYIPGMAWALVIAALLWEASERPTLLRSGMLCAGALAALWGVLSFHQMRIWRNNLSLFEHMVRELDDDRHRDDVRRRLGGYYAGLGRFEDAARQYQTALRLAPSAKTYQAAAELFDRRGDAEAALTNYLNWIQLDPSAPAHLRAAAQLTRLGRGDQAILHYRQALRLHPDFAPALSGLAWVLATDRIATNRNGIEALKMAQRVQDISGKETARTLEVHAAACAEVGRYQDAIALARQARNLAEATGDAELAEQCRQLLGRFDKGQPWREQGPIADSRNP